MRCIYCLGPANIREHVIPRGAGGTDDERNIVPACQSCNVAKGGYPVENFLRDFPDVVSRVRAYQDRAFDLGRLSADAPRFSILENYKATTIRVTPEVQKALRQAALNHDRSIQSIISDGIADQLARLGVVVE